MAKKISILNYSLISIGAVAVFASAFCLFPNVADAKFGECQTGYYFDARSGIGCKQINCAEVADGHYSFEGYCLCGTSNTDYEKPTDPNKECYLPQTDTGCPGCLVKCVHFDEKCPGEFGIKETQEAEPGKGLYWMVQDAFSKFMSIGGDLLEAATGIKINEKIDSDAFYEAIIIFPDGKPADLRLFHANLEFNKKNGLAFELNAIEIKTPGQGAFIDEWSLGIGLGAANEEGVSHDVPLTPISPHISFTNIKNWFSEKWNDVKSEWYNNAPWFLGGNEPSPIPGMNNNR